jgi:hypothetical protein
MKATFAAALLAAASGALAASNDTGVVYVTDVVTAYTTYCPEATVLTHGSQTITVTGATTLTLSAQTITSAVSTAATSAPYPVTNGTATVGTASGTGAGAASTSAFAGAANVNQAGMGLAAIMGLAAFAL